MLGRSASFALRRCLCYKEAMLSRRCFLTTLLTPALLALRPDLLNAQEGVFLSEEEAPRAVFPEATHFEKKVIPSTEALREKMKALLGRTRPSIWEDAYVTYLARRNDERLGFAVITEEIGKHRPITFIVGIKPDGKVKDVALMTYREAYGGEVRDRRFMRQYHEKDLTAPLLPYRDIVNIAGATLSVQSIGRGVRKVLALAQLVLLNGSHRP
ncbi:MAG: FMN-binding protein [candidate division NC10 bacterium]|nr:FMN-binding protein [candidate division NC10 bacterium]MDE2322467.1 FMN-binding protein [candidate division NC10 bacterium]